MKFKEITLANVSTEAKVETLGIVLDKELESLYGVVNSVEAMKGDKGDKGEQGVPGKDGADGKNGLNGKDGINGKDGKDGVDGEDGEEAPKIVDAEIAIDDTLLLTLSDGSQIKTTKPVVGERGTNGSNGANGSKGDKGDPGETGAAGVGIAVGGTTDQVLAKNSSTDYDTKWTTLGSMSTQNANAVAITGGTINGTTVGSTTPSTVNATTLSGQTGVLRGTGQNLQLQSQTFINGTTWSPANGITPTANVTTAPDSTNTGSSFSESLTTTNQSISELTSSITLGLTYTYSVYAKASTATAIQLTGRASPFGSNIWANFNLSNGTVGSVGSTATASIVNAGSGWYRCIVTGTATGSATGSFALTLIDNNPSAVRFPSYLGTGRTVFLWGAQLELGSTANTYIPTTTTAVYGTPTLSFSGVSTIGLQSNGALFLQPAGTGAIQAQQATSTTAGGNVRGANAVDWQTVRGSAGQVASGAQSTLSGGTNNTASGQNSAVLGGAFNIASGFSSVVCGGYANQSASQRYTFIGSGYSNNATGYFNFIGGGYANSGTANAAVTTQATTTVTNGSTAVTLSGSNANIKVGQLVTGTGIQSFPDTYVAAISGTSLTLSQNATASGSPTLSFFTPHGVVVGGGNNRATGSYSFIGGGGDAGTAANRNVASGDWSFVGGGKNNTASAIGAVVCGGGLDGGSSALGNTASELVSFVGGGLGNSATGVGSSILGGYQNTANAFVSSVIGGRRGTTRSITGNQVNPACNSPVTNVLGVSQAAMLVLGTQTTDATPTALRSDTSAAGTTNQVIMPNNSAYFFRGEVVSGVTGGGDTKGWTIEGVIKRGANAASTALVGTPTVTSSFADAGASTWAIAVTADTTNGGLRVTFTGQAATTIRTVCQIRTTEMTF